MKLFYSPTSPYVRKVMIVAHEAGVADRIERLPSAANPVTRDQTIVAKNPLGQVPTLIADDGTVFADSAVICEYLDSLGTGTLFPKSGPTRWPALIDHAMADGILGAALLLRYETFTREERLRWPGWIVGQWEKIHTSLDWFEAKAQALAGRVDIGTIGVASAVSYLDLRFAADDWRARAPKLAVWYEGFAARPSMTATELKA